MYGKTLFVRLIAGIMIIVVLAPAVQAGLISYTFDDGLQGWTNILTASEGIHSFVNTSHRYLGLSTPGISVYAENPFRDDPHNSGLLIRSQAFSFDSLSGIAISFQLAGGSEGTSPVTDADAALSAPSTPDGFLGLMLRHVPTGAYVLTGQRTNNVSSLQTITWDTAALASTVNTTDAYTLDLIDTDHGSWGWIALDNVSMTGVTIVPEPATLALLGLGGLLLRRKK